MTSFGVAIGFALAIATVVNADGWGQASQGSDNTPREPIAGGWTPVDLSDPDESKKLKELSEYAVQAANEQSNDLYRQSLIRVVSAQSQIVAGVQYNITFTTGQSSCRKTPETLTATSDACPVSNAAGVQYKRCTATIWVKPWLNFRETTLHGCVPADTSVLTDASKSIGHRPFSPDNAIRGCVFIVSLAKLLFLMYDIA